jgi:orotate phosphoribosyltransferase
MPLTSETQTKIAEYLLQIKAIKLQPQEPFLWASGWKSPIYCDNRVSLSFPVIRTYIRQQMVKLVQEEFGTPEIIVGIATAGIPQGVLIAQELGLPFAYVRSAPKDHGRQNIIEGEVGEGQRAVLIEDLVSTGKSSLNAISALKDKGVEVVGLVSIFNYGFEEAEKAFQKIRCRFFSLSNYDILLDVAVKNNYINASHLEILRVWRLNPSNWGQVVVSK